MASNANAVPRGRKKNIFARMWGAICNYFRPIGHAMKYGDWATRLSFLISGFGYFFHGREQEIIKHEVVTDENGHSDIVTTSTHHYVTQWLRGLFYLIIEVLVVLAVIFWGVPNFPKLGLNNLAQCSYNEYWEYVCPDGATEGDVAFKILLLSIITIIILIAFLFIHLSSIRGVYKSQCDIAENKTIKSAKDDLHDLIDEKFYVTVLAIPVLGILTFTLVPTVIMIIIGFTNYGGLNDAGQQTDFSNFGWAGFKGWGELFGIGSNDFAIVFGQQLLWTLIWAFLATFTCFFGGLLLALLLNAKRTRFTKVWRTGFVITIAVPQFVSLMLIRYFLDDNGIVNGLLASWGIIDSQNPIKFLTDPFITKVTIIVINCWVGFPYLMLMISGILLNIPADLYESATIDGAGRVKMFWSITMPYIMQVCTPYLISSFVSNINNFNVIYLLTMNTPETNQSYINVSAKQSDLLITWLYNMISAGAEKKYYLASIVGIIMFVISTVFTLITFNLTTGGRKERRMG